MGPPDDPNGPRRHWVLPDEPRGRPPIPRSILLAGVLLIALGLLVAPLGPLLVGVAGALQLDPELAELNVPLEVVRTISSIGVLALFGGVFQLVAGIGVLLLRRWARTLGIGVALVSAISFGLAAVVLSTTAGQPDFRRIWQLDAPFAIVLLLAMAGGYLVAAIALTQDWPAEGPGR
jgi:hypothetical protein